MSNIKICILSTSPSQDSVSRATARVAEEILNSMEGVSIDFIDLRETPIELYPGTKSDPIKDDLVRRFKEADGWVVAGAVFNAGPCAHLINFFHYTLGSSVPKGRPFITIGGAGGSGSVYAYDSIGARIRRECTAIEIGTPVISLGDTQKARGFLEILLPMLVSIARLH